MQLETSIVRILTGTKTAISTRAAIGAGFLIDTYSVITCAHVIADALSIDRRTSINPTMEVLLDFPLVRAGEIFTAHTLFWYPIQDNGGGDIAILKLDGPAPEGISFARLVTAEELWGHEFRVYGFPRHHYNGTWASGKISGREATDWVQIESLKETGYSIQPGFSGAAVWDVQLDGVVGMVVASEENQNIKAAFMIPAHELVKVYPQLQQRIIPPCPYRGLLAFREQDAAYFFGQEIFTRQLVDAVHKKALVALIGPSGSGKSSVVFAGLIPHLRQEQNWLIASFRPGSSPLNAVANVLIQLLEPDMNELHRIGVAKELTQNLQQGKLSFQDVLVRLGQKYNGIQLLLFVDQFEELYTECQDYEEQYLFLNMLLAVVTKQIANFHLLITLRADFFGLALSYRPMADAFQLADIKIGPLSLSQIELEKAIRKPAEKLHVQIEQGLTERILRDIGQEANNLSVLEFTLTLLWEKQRNGKLQHASYNNFGGIEKALSDYAEEIYARLNEDEQLQVQHIFEQLVRPGDGTEDTRRLARRTEIGEDDWQLVIRLANDRLVITNRNGVNDEETVEVIHEALIRRWPRLRKWIEENRELLFWHERMRTALQQWEKGEYDVGDLLRGRRLLEALSWQEVRSIALTAEEQDFIKASQQHAREEEQSWKRLFEEVQKEHEEAEQQRLRAEGRRYEAEQQRRLAEEQKVKAEEQQKIALARQLAAQAELLRDRYPHLMERSVLLAVESLRRFPTPEADQAVRDGSALLRRRLMTLSHHAPVSKVMFSPDGRFLITCTTKMEARSTLNDVIIWEMSSSRRIAMFAHKESVAQIALSPNGALLASASTNENIEIWEVATGRHMTTLNHQESVSALVFSPNPHRTTLAIASMDNIVNLWSFSSNQHHLLKHERAVSAVVFSVDGRFVATISTDRTVNIWDSTSGEHIDTLSHSGAVSAVAFSFDGRFLATASEDKTSMWKITYKCLLFRTQTHQSTVSAIAFSPDKRTFVTVTTDKTVKIWEIDSGQALSTFVHNRNIAMFRFSPTGHVMATVISGQEEGSTFNIVELWEVRSGRRIASLNHMNAVTALAFHPAGQLLATASADQTAALWDTSQGQRLGILAHQGIVSALAFSPTDQIIATASADTAVGLWEITGGQAPGTAASQQYDSKVTVSPDGHFLATIIHTHSSFSAPSFAEIWQLVPAQRLAFIRSQNSVIAIVFNHTGSLLAVTTTRGRGNTSIPQFMEIWKSNGHYLTTLEHQTQVKQVLFSPDGRFLVSHDSKTIRVWQVSNMPEASGSRSPLIALIDHDQVSDIAFSPDGRFLAAIVNTTTAKIWEITDGHLLTTLTSQDLISKVTFGLDGQCFATIHEENTVKIWETTTGNQLARLDHEGRITSIAFSPDGRLLASASSNEIAFIWDIRTGTRLATPLVHQGAVSTVIFSPDGQMLATTSQDRTARVWEVSSGRPLVRLSHEMMVQAAIFSRDSRYLTTISGSHVHSWLYRAEDLIHETQIRLTRNLTQAEWKQYINEADEDLYHKIYPDLQ